MLGGRAGVGRAGAGPRWRSGGVAARGHRGEEPDVGPPGLEVPRRLVRGADGVAHELVVHRRGVGLRLGRDDLRPHELPARLPAARAHAVGSTASDRPPSRSPQSVLRTARVPSGTTTSHAAASSVVAVSSASSAGAPGAPVAPAAVPAVPTSATSARWASTSATRTRGVPGAGRPPWGRRPRRRPPRSLPRSPRSPRSRRPRRPRPARRADRRRAGRRAADGRAAVVQDGERAVRVARERAALHRDHGRGTREGERDVGRTLGVGRDPGRRRLARRRRGHGDLDRRAPHGHADGRGLGVAARVAARVVRRAAVLRAGAGTGDGTCAGADVTASGPGDGVSGVHAASTTGTRTPTASAPSTVAPRRPPAAARRERVTTAREQAGRATGHVHEADAVERVDLVGREPADVVGRLVLLDAGLHGPIMRDGGHRPGPSSSMSSSRRDTSENAIGRWRTERL